MISNRLNPAAAVFKTSETSVKKDASKMNDLSNTNPAIDEVLKAVLLENKELRKQNGELTQEITSLKGNLSEIQNQVDQLGKMLEGRLSVDNNLADVKFSSPPQSLPRSQSPSPSQSSEFDDLIERLQANLTSSNDYNEDSDVITPSQENLPKQKPISPPVTPPRSPLLQPVTPYSQVTSATIEELKKELELANQECNMLNHRRLSGQPETYQETISRLQQTSAYYKNKIEEGARRMSLLKKERITVAQRSLPLPLPLPTPPKPQMPAASQPALSYPTQGRTQRTKYQPFPINPGLPPRHNNGRYNH